MRGKKRLCFVLPDANIGGGQEKVTYRLANELSSDYQVYLYSLKPLCGSSIFEMKSDVKSGSFDNSSFLRRITSIVKFLKSECIDILFVVGNPNYLCSLVKLFCKTKVVFCSHSAIVESQTKGKTKLNHILTCFFSDKVVSLTEADSRDFQQLFGLRKRKSMVIPNWIEKTGTENDCSNSNRAICVSRLSKEKGVDRLIDMATLLHPKNDSWGIDVYGDGPLRNELQARIDDLQLTKRIRLKGQTKDLDSMYGKYAFCLLTSHLEGLPMCLLEAKAHFLPIVSFDIRNGPSEIIENNINGYLIKDGDIVEYAKKVGILFDELEVRKLMSANASLRMNIFSKKKIIDLWIALIEDMTNEK